MRVNSLKDSRNASFPTTCPRTESTSRLLLRILLGRIWGSIPAELYNHKSSARNGTAELLRRVRLRFVLERWRRRARPTALVPKLPTKEHDKNGHPPAPRNIQLPKPILAGCDSGTRMV